MPKLRRAVEVLKAVKRQPRLSEAHVGQLPSAVRGRQYGRAWVSTTSPAGIATHDGTNPLEQFFNSRTDGRGIWKWTHYFEIYHRHLHKFIGTDVHLAEVGVYSGGSLEMWRAYLGEKSRIYGIDIKEECRALQNDSTRIFIGDQASRGFWQHFRQEAPVVDILIDDGGHWPEQQIVTLEEVLPHLRPGGIFICEDVVGDFNKFGAFVSGLAANIDANSLHEGEGKELSSKATPFQSEIHSIHRYPYVIVIEKRAAPVRQFTAHGYGTEWTWLTSHEKKELLNKQRLAG
jgi:hypothetical protein